MVSLIANKCFATKILFCICDSQISQQLLNLIAKHQNSVNSKNLQMYSWKIIHGKHKRIALQSLIKGSSVSPGATPAYLIAMNIAAERSSCVTRRNEMRQMRRVCVILIDFLEIPSTTQWALFTTLLLSLCKGLILYKSNGFCLSGSKANFSCTLHHAVIFQLYICS